MEDRVVEELIGEEFARQKTSIELIASENFVSDDVLKCMGSVLTNKYSEGYPGKRYYAGNEVIDKIERLCQQRALKLFAGEGNDEYGVNVQPYSGSPANLAVYTAVLNPGDTFMGMNLQDGGHLTHGYKTKRGKSVSATSLFWNSVLYGVDPSTELIDYESLQQLATSTKPKLIVAGFSAYTRVLNFDKLRQIADSVSALLMVDMAHVAGLIASRLYPSPFNYADIVTTTTHKTLRGPRAGMIFYRKDCTFMKGDTPTSLKDCIDSAVFPGLQGGPHNNVIAGIAVCLHEASQPSFVTYSSQVLTNCKTMERFFKDKNYTLVSGGSDNHMLLINTKASCGLDGEEAEAVLNSINISVNKNACPGDTSVMRPSGIRVGTPAITTKMFKEEKVTKLCEIMHQALTEMVVKKEKLIYDLVLVQQLRQRVVELCLE